MGVSIGGIEVPAVTPSPPLARVATPTNPAAPPPKSQKSSPRRLDESMAIHRVGTVGRIMRSDTHGVT
jgi:hypothetical protein